MPNTKTNRDGLLVTENVRIFLMKTDGNGPGAAGKESVMNLLGMRSLGKIKEKGEKIMFWIELVIMLLLIFWGVRKGGRNGALYQRGTAVLDPVIEGERGGN